MLLYSRGFKAVLILIKRSKVFSQTIMVHDHEKVPQIRKVGKICRKLPPFNRKYWQRMYAFAGSHQ